MVPVAEIASPANDYNLNIPRYIDSSEPEDLHDLDAHLNGGIPDRDIDALDAYWRVFPTLRKALFQDNGREGYSEPRVPRERAQGSDPQPCRVHRPSPSAWRACSRAGATPTRPRSRASRSTTCPAN